MCIYKDTEHSNIPVLRLGLVPTGILQNLAQLGFFPPKSLTVFVYFRYLGAPERKFFFFVVFLTPPPKKKTDTPPSGGYRCNDMRNVYEYVSIK